MKNKNENLQIFLKFAPPLILGSKVRKSDWLVDL